MNVKKLLQISDDNVYVLGNQSADLDSCASALSLASLLSTVNPRVTSIALIQGERGDLGLKPEITALLVKAGLKISDLQFTSQLVPPGLKKKAVFLVDHNHPEKENLDYSVIGIIDHHKDSGYLKSLPLRDIRVCGSCCSIISEYWHKLETKIPYSQRLLLAGAIEIDTGGLNDDWGKSTELDRQQYQILKAGLQNDDIGFLKTLQGIKNDLDHLNMTDHLRRDYKDFPLHSFQGGISSVPLSTEFFFRNDFFDPTLLDEFCQSRCPGFLLIMHSFGSPLQRELSLYCPTGSQKGIKKRLKRALKALETAPFDLNKEGHQQWYHYRLKDSKTSRKILIPLLLHELAPP